MGSVVVKVGLGQVVLRALYILSVLFHRFPIHLITLVIRLTYYQLTASLTNTLRGALWRNRHN
jgi:hypothetical protein